MHPSLLMSFARTFFNRLYCYMSLLDPFGTLKPGRIAATLARDMELYSKAVFQYPQAGSYRCNPVNSLE
jgi:hypothetical protein